MRWPLTAVTTGALAFAATNIDDIFVLTLFFGETGQGSRRWRVVVGQYLGFTALVAVSLIGSFLRLVVPRAWIGLLGLAPVFIGIKKLFEWKSGRDDHSVKRSDSASVFTVAVVTFANGGDNLGIYTPLFAASDFVSLLVMLCVFFVLVAAWCVIGYFLGSHPAISGMLERYGHLIVPFVLIGLGIYIMSESNALGLIR